MNGILLHINEHPFMVVFKIKDYSKINVINAVSKYTGVNSEYIEQISASTTYGLYGFKSTFHDGGTLQEIRDYSDENFPFVFRIDYLKIL